MSWPIVLTLSHFCIWIFVPSGFTNEVTLGLSVSLILDSLSCRPLILWIKLCDEDFKNCVTRFQLMFLYCHVAFIFALYSARMRDRMSGVLNVLGYRLDISKNLLWILLVLGFKRILSIWRSSVRWFAYLFTEAKKIVISHGVVEISFWIILEASWDVCILDLFYLSLLLGLLFC